MRWVLPLLLVLAAPAADAFGLHTEPGPTPAVEATYAVRWSATATAFADGGDAGLGGGIEFSVDADFCTVLAKGWVGTFSCAHAIAGLYDAMAMWERANPTIRFTDVSTRMLATDDGDRIWASGGGAELDIIAVSNPRETSRGVSSVTHSRFVPDSFQRLANGTMVAGRSFTLADIEVFVATGCPSVGFAGCYDDSNFRMVLGHEIGHALGLDHPFEQTAHMQFAATPTCGAPSAAVRYTSRLDASIMNYEETGANSPVPTQDDVDGIEVLYPACPLRAVGSSAFASGASAATLAGAQSPLSTEAFRVQGTKPSSTFPWPLMAVLLVSLATLVTIPLILLTRRRRPQPVWGPGYAISAGQGAAWQSMPPGPFATPGPAPAGPPFMPAAPAPRPGPPPMRVAPPNPPRPPASSPQRPVPGSPPPGGLGVPGRPASSPSVRRVPGLPPPPPRPPHGPPRSPGPGRAPAPAARPAPSNGAPARPSPTDREPSKPPGRRS